LIAHVVTDARLVRRVLKQQRGLSGFGLQVPHGHCCVIERAALLRIVSEGELGKKSADLPATIVLVARPELDDVRGVWRRAFHGHVHHHLERRVHEGTLTHALVRERIHRIGQTEFDEIRAVLRGENLLFSAGDDREAYIEFAAFHLELSHFDPDHVEQFFPSIRDRKAIDDTLALDVDDRALLEGCRPEGAAALSPAASLPLTSVAPRSLAPVARRSRTERDPVAGDAKRKGNVVRSMLVRMRAGEEADDDVAELATRLHSALPEPAHEHVHAPTPTIDAWRVVILALAEVAARSESPRSLEARVLHDLQKTCVDAERRRNAVDVVTWVTSLFRRPIVRPLPTVAVVRVARHLKHAFASSHRAALSKAERANLESVFRGAIARAVDNARATIKPALEGVLDEVGLGPKSVPERVAREKLSEEILDLVIERGSLGLSALRDALSRSNLKLSKLAPAELVTGDPILRADALLATRLDGVYRRGEIYLRFLQKVSSVAFGTWVGRIVTLHVALPLLLSFVLLEGLQHVAHPVGRALGHPHVHLLSLPSFLGLALFFYGLIHSAAVRGAARGAARGVGSVLHAVLIGVPSFILSSAPVRAITRSRLVSLATKPLLLAGLVYLVSRRAGLERTPALAATAAIAALTMLFLATPTGRRVEEAVTDTALRQLRQLSHRALPGLFAFIVDVFRIFIERVERGIYTVDEWLTFKEGQSSFSLATKGALALVWFFATYLLRIYVNLLIEPQVNPIKHFPVVTVSHKIVLPMSPTILAAIRPPLAPLGAVASNAIAGSTVFLLPGVFGFLVWELKANWNLYDQNRSKTLDPVRIGHHGETMNGLLVLGFHQGTIPKLYAKLRRAAKRRQSKVNVYRQQIHEVEHAIETFVERELIGLLKQAKRWRAGELEVHAIEVGSNRIRVGIECKEVSADVAWLEFEEQSGSLVASVASAGFIDALTPDPRATFEIALAGLYKRAGVDIVREQVESLLGQGVAYDISAEGLVVWPGEGYATEVVYALDGSGSASGVVRGEPLAVAPAPLDRQRLLFGRQAILWPAWVAAFREEDASSPRVIDGPPLLVRERTAGRAARTSAAPPR
jgi:hypothetical protein